MPRVRSSLPLQVLSWTLATPSPPVKKATRKGRLFQFSGFPLQHLGAIHVDAVTLDLPGDCDVVPFMPLQRFRIAHRQNLLILVGDNDHLRAFSDALFRAFRGAFMRSLYAALGITDPTIDGRRIACE